MLHCLNDGNAAVVVATGRYTALELERAVDDALRCTKEHGQVRGLIVDFTASEELAARPVRQLESIARFLASRGEEYANRLALIAATDVGYGLLRLTSAHTARRGVETSVFRVYTSAIVWINADAGLGTPLPRAAESPWQRADM